MSKKKKINLLGIGIILIIIGFSFIFVSKDSRAETGQVWQTCESGTLSTGIGWDYTMGYQFTPLSDGRITKLCGFFSGTKRVRLFSSSYSTLASTNVSSSNNWACTSVTPVDVTSGSTYYVVVDLASSGGAYRRNAGLPSTCGDIRINTSVYQRYSGTFTSSHTSYAINMYGMVDVVFTKELPVGCLSDLECDDSVSCTDDVCNNPGLPGSTCSNVNKTNGTDCGDCQECQAGVCSYLCPQIESSCECISDSCVDCSDYYGETCGYTGKCNCSSTQTPTWSCGAGGCSCTCTDNLAVCAACEDHSLSGYAWTGDAVIKEGLGWISLSCKNENGPINYGVDIGVDGNMTGYAYFDMNDTNTTIDESAWIDFNPSSGFPGSPNFSARVDLDGTTCGEVGKICGWARAVNTDSSWDGWLKLSKDSSDSGTNYEILLDSSVTPSTITGYAWGSDVLGWVKIDAQTDFTIAPPVIVSEFRLEGNIDYCTSVQKRGYATLSWLYEAEKNQEEYELEISTNSGFSGETSIYRSQTISPDSRGSTGLTIIPSPTLLNLEIGYNNTYYLRLKAKDTEGTWSDWATPIPLIITTASHAHPFCGFEWTPQSPAVDETAVMINNSICYDISNNPINCSLSNWTIPAGATFEDATNSSSFEPHIKFTSTGDSLVTLITTDNNGYTCSKDNNIGVKLPFPDWIEVNPE